MQLKKLQTKKYKMTGNRIHSTNTTKAALASRQLIMLCTVAKLWSVEMEEGA